MTRKFVVIKRNSTVSFVRSSELVVKNLLQHLVCLSKEKTLLTGIQ